MNKKIGSLVVAGLTVMLLQACGGPKNLTPEEKEARQKATLNVYEDNRVWFKAGGNSPFYAWTKDPAKAFALMINGWHSPIVTDTSVRRILDFQTVLG